MYEEFVALIVDIIPRWYDGPYVTIAELCARDWRVGREIMIYQDHYRTLALYPMATESSCL